MNCKVTLLNSDGGEFYSAGTIELIEKGFILAYKIGADDGKITYKNGELTQERYGSVVLKMHFSSGKQTQCTLGEGEMQGCFPVFTENLLCELTEREVNLKLSYNLGEEPFTLELNVKIDDTNCR